MQRLRTVMTSSAASKFRLALVQLQVSSDKEANLKRATEMVREAAGKGAAQMIALPECFNSPYGTQYFPKYAEVIPGPSTAALSKIAQETGAYLVGGSIPEKDGDKIYNTCTVYNPEGKMIAKYRKMHLFDIDVPGGIKFTESDILSPGNELVTFQSDWCQVGLGICYDMRFSELAQLYSRKGCQLVIYPGAFNMTTGPAHWELLIRSRALDNQVYTAAVSVAHDRDASYVAWGHSTIVSPWGEVVQTIDDEEGIVYANIDLDKLKSIREQIPITKQRREDIYHILEK